MKLLWQNQTCLFEPVLLHFEHQQSENVFARKHNKTVAETLLHPRYQKLEVEVKGKYALYLDWALGECLLHLKSQGDSFYLNFLNRYGDRQYSTFYIDDEQYLDKKGLYIFSVNDDIRYLGRCRDSFKKRINQGYGKIHPKNCYIDGQVTNCHLNALITEQSKDTKLWVCPMDDNDLIAQMEKDLISVYSPSWNITLKSS